MLHRQIAHLQPWSIPPSRYLQRKTIVLHRRLLKIFEG
jgi:hypothetical protein